jgi:hypothetical protein
MASKFQNWCVRAVSTSCTGALVMVIACSSSSSDTGPSDASSGSPVEAGSCASPGGPASGPADTHCVAEDGGMIIQPTDQAGCTDCPDAADDGGPGESVEAGIADGTCGNSDYGVTMFGHQGSDDDCKYNVTWTSTPICEGQPVLFTVTATKRVDNSPLTGANPRPDVSLNCAIPPGGMPADPSPETSPGTYTVGPVIFTQSGKWSVRFHFNETCCDAVPTSPHGHAAFWVQVP